MTKARKANKDQDWAIYVLQCFEGLPGQRNWKLLNCPQRWQELPTLI